MTKEGDYIAGCTATVLTLVWAVLTEVDPSSAGVWPAFWAYAVLGTMFKLMLLGIDAVKVLAK